MQLQFQISDIYKGFFDNAALQAHLQAELNFYLAEQFGLILGNFLSTEDLQQLNHEAKTTAWQQYQGTFLENLTVK